MATPNVGILTTAGKALIAKVNSGQAKISFSKVVFSSMDNSQLSDTQVKALTAISPQEVVVSPPETTLDTTSGETRIRATGTNKQLADGVYVKTYGVFAKDDAGNEILYGVTVSPNPNYFPAYDGVTPQAVTYSYKTVIQEASNITMTNSNDVYVTQEDLTEAIGKIPQPDLSNYATQQQLAIKADDSKVVHTADMRKPASDVVGLEDVSQAVLKPNLNSGVDLHTVTNPGIYPFNGCTFVNDLNSDTKWGFLIVTDVGNGVILQQMVQGNGQKYGQHIYNGGSDSWSDWVTPANTDDVTTAIRAATANMADTTKPTNFTAGLQSGGVNVATNDDLDNYYHANTSDEAALAAAKAATFPGIYWFEED